MKTPVATYEIDSTWKIVHVSEAFCRAFRCTDLGLMGRDVRDLLREDWRLDFRAYVTRALVGVGDADLTLPMVAPCGELTWFKHTLQPLMADGSLIGYRATIAPYIIHPAPPAKPWWDWRGLATQQVWNMESQPLARAS